MGHGFLHAAPSLYHGWVFRGEGWWRSAAERECCTRPEDGLMVTWSTEYGSGQSGIIEYCGHHHHGCLAPLPLRDCSVPLEVVGAMAVIK
jgi:hypothetical protein